MKCKEGTVINKFDEWKMLNMLFGNFLMKELFNSPELFLRIFLKYYKKLFNCRYEHTEETWENNKKWRGGSQIIIMKKIMKSSSTA